jgi:CDP-glycerol glycerophosphotransferase
MPKYAVNASKYDEMQELLCMADVLITDYSSSQWDFALTGKPGFLFTPDLDYYQHEDRGFYTPIDDWPFPYAKTNEELSNLIKNNGATKVTINEILSWNGSQYEYQVKEKEI